MNTIDLAFQRSRGIAPTLTGVCRLKVEAEIVVRHGAQEGGRGREAMPLQPACQSVAAAAAAAAVDPAVFDGVFEVVRAGGSSIERTSERQWWTKSKKGEQQSRGKGSKIPSDVRPPGRC